MVQHNHIQKAWLCKRTTPVLILQFVLFLPPSALAVAKLTIGYATLTARLMPLWVAHEQGILGKYGIDAQPILIRGAPTLVAGLAGHHRQRAAENKWPAPSAIRRG